SEPTSRRFWRYGARTIRSSCRRAPKRSSVTFQTLTCASSKPATSPSRRTARRSLRQSATSCRAPSDARDLETLHMATVVSVNVGLPQDVEWQGKTVRTAIWKRPVTGRVLAGRLNLAGDAQADLLGHGGEQRAIMVYQLDSYRYWEQKLGRSD